MKITRQIQKPHPQLLYWILVMKVHRTVLTNCLIPYLKEYVYILAYVIVSPH